MNHRYVNLKVSEPGHNVICEVQITLYTSRRYDFSEAIEIDAPDSTMLGKESYYVILLFVPWSIGPNIARG